MKAMARYLSEGKKGPPFDHRQAMKYYRNKIKKGGSLEKVL